jgi:hypothetical protein
MEYRSILRQKIFCSAVELVPLCDGTAAQQLSRAQHD